MYRVIDCNLNRASEGYRVLEDLARFVYNNKDLYSKIKLDRHLLRSLSKNIETDLINSRDSNSDFGRDCSPFSKDTGNMIVLRNFKRIQEALRSLEEIFKTKGFIEDGKKIESLRYNSYTLEKEYHFIAIRPRLKLEGIYGITNSRDSLDRSNIDVVKEMINAGIKIIQYREKDLTHKKMLEECKVIRRLTRESGAIFIINDFIDIAMAVKSDGVHLGQDDLSISDARKILGNNFFIGVSTHSPIQGTEALKNGADYIGVGPIFKTDTKKSATPVGLEYLDWVVQNLDIPFVAIGGIKEHNLNQILNAGAKCVSLVSEITSSPCIKEKVENLNKIFRGVLSEV